MGVRDGAESGQRRKLTFFVEAVSPFCGGKDRGARIENQVSERSRKIVIFFLDGVHIKLAHFQIFGGHHRSSASFVTHLQERKIPKDVVFL